MGTFTSPTITWAMIDGTFLPLEASSSSAPYGLAVDGNVNQLTARVFNNGAVAKNGGNFYPPAQYTPANSPNNLPRHSGQACMNVLFCDGHVKSTPPLNPNAVYGGCTNPGCGAMIIALPWYNPALPLPSGAMATGCVTSGDNAGWGCCEGDVTQACAAWTNPATPGWTYAGWWW